MSLQNCTTLFYIFCYNVSPKRDHSCMTDNIIIIHCHISCSSPYIHKNNSGFLFIIRKNSIRRCQRLKDHILNCHICFPDTFLNVLRSSYLPYNDVKISFQTPSAHTNRTLHPGFVIDNKILRNDMYNLFAYIDMNLMHIFDQPENFLFLDFIFISLTNDISAVLHTFNMLTCDTDKHFRKHYTGPFLHIIHGCLDCIDCLFNIQYNTPFNTLGKSFA